MGSEAEQQPRQKLFKIRNTVFPFRGKISKYYCCSFMKSIMCVDRVLFLKHLIAFEAVDKILGQVLYLERLLREGWFWLTEGHSDTTIG